MDKVIIRQNRNFEFEISAQNEGEDKTQQVDYIYELTRYTMMLASLGFCTGIVLHTYAQHHDVDLAWVELTLIYHREESGEGRGDYTEWIEEKMQLEGDLSAELRERLRRIGHHCSIRQMLEEGIAIRSSSADSA